ncbi:MAG: DMT family transporter [Rhizobiaceae bacterium]
MAAERPLIWALAAIALWSTNAFVAKLVLADLPVSTVQFLQFAGATMVFAAMRFSTGDRAPVFALPTAALALGLAGLVGTMVLQYLAFSLMPVIEANLIAYTWPLLVAAGLILAGRAARPLRLGLLSVTGFLGAALVITGGHHPMTGSGEIWGYIAAIGSALCMAVYTLYVARVSVSPQRLLLPSAIIGLAGTAAWSLWHGLPEASASTLLAGLYLGAGPMGLGYLFWSRAMRADTGGRAAILAYLTPIGSTALLFASGENLTQIAALGAALVIAACIAVGAQQNERKVHA